jgi:hypothetical protein
MEKRHFAAPEQSERQSRKLHLAEREKRSPRAFEPLIRPLNRSKTTNENLDFRTPKTSIFDLSDYFLDELPDFPARTSGPSASI